MRIKLKHLHLLTQCFNKNISSLKQHAIICKLNEEQEKILQRPCNLNVPSYICWLKAPPLFPFFPRIKSKILTYLIHTHLVKKNTFHFFRPFFPISVKLLNKWHISAVAKLQVFLNDSIDRVPHLHSIHADGIFYFSILIILVWEWNLKHIKLHSKKKWSKLWHLSQDTPFPGVSESTYAHQLTLRILCILCHDCYLKNKHISSCWLTEYKIPLQEWTLLTKRKLLNGVYTPLRKVICAHLITWINHACKAGVRCWYNHI